MRSSLYRLHVEIGTYIRMYDIFTLIPIVNRAQILVHFSFPYRYVWLYYYIPYLPRPLYVTVSKFCINLFLVS